MPKRKRADVTSGIPHDDKKAEADPRAKGRPKKKAKVASDKSADSKSRPWSYHTGVVSEDESTRLFEEVSGLIHESVEKHGQPTVKVCGVEHKQPRLVAYYSRTGASYSYSGATPVNAGWPDPLPKLAAIASSMTNGAVFDSALCNLYRNGRDCVGLHRDKDAMHGYIVSFSFYPDGAAERDFVITDNNKKRVELTSLANGSVVVMQPGMQQQYMHSVPRRTRITTPRINVTLRHHPERSTRPTTPSSSSSSSSSTSSSSSSSSAASATVLASADSASDPPK